MTTSSNLSTPVKAAVNPEPAAESARAQALFGDTSEKHNHDEEKHKHNDEEHKHNDEEHKHNDEEHKHNDEKHKHVEEKHKHHEEKHKHHEEKHKHNEEKHKHNEKFDQNDSSNDASNETSESDNANFRNMFNISKPLSSKTTHTSSSSSGSTSSSTDASSLTTPSTVFEERDTKPDAKAPQDTSKSGLVKKFFCKTCNQGFTRKHNMASHELIHTTIKLHVCATCNSTFRRIHDLKRHEKLHTGEKPYFCSACGRRFARPDALTRHFQSTNACSGKSQEKPTTESAIDDSSSNDNKPDDKTDKSHSIHQNHARKEKRGSLPPPGKPFNNEQSLPLGSSSSFDSAGSNKVSSSSEPDGTPPESTQTNSSSDTYSYSNYNDSQSNSASSLPKPGFDMSRWNPSSSTIGSNTKSSSENESNAIAMDAATARPDGTVTTYSKKNSSVHSSDKHELYNQRPFRDSQVPTNESPADSNMGQNPLLYRMISPFTGSSGKDMQNNPRFAPNFSKVAPVQATPQPFQQQQELQQIQQLQQQHLLQQHQMQQQQPHVQQPHVQQPHVQQPHVQQPHVQQPHVQQPHVQQPHVQQPHVQQPHVQQLQPPLNTDPKYGSFVYAQSRGGWQGNMHMHKSGESVSGEPWQYSRDLNFPAHSQYEPNSALANQDPNRNISVDDYQNLLNYTHSLQNSLNKLENRMELIEGQVARDQRNSEYKWTKKRRKSRG